MSGGAWRILRFKACGLNWHMDICVGPLDAAPAAQRVIEYQCLMPRCDREAEDVLKAVLAPHGYQPVRDILTAWLHGPCNTPAGWSALADVLHLRRELPFLIAGAAVRAIAASLQPTPRPLASQQPGDTHDGQ